MVFASLESDFLTMPKGQGFVEYPAFETGYEALKQATQGFRGFDPEAVRAALLQPPYEMVKSLFTSARTPASTATRSDKGGPA